MDAAAGYPPTPTKRAAIWRDRLARDDATLLILDNAGGTDQVSRRCCPGWAGCLVLVTSRDGLDDLPAAVNNDLA